MDPVRLILTSLVAGAKAAAKDTTSQAVKDACASLKSLVQKRFAEKPEAETALAQYENKPEVWKAPLQDALVETGADKDGEGLQRPQKALKLVQPQQAAQGKYNIQIGEGKGIVIGDNAQVMQTFGEDE